MHKTKQQLSQQVGQASTLVFDVFESDVSNWSGGKAGSIDNGHQRCTLIVQVRL